MKRTSFDRRSPLKPKRSRRQMRAPRYPSLLPDVEAAIRGKGGPTRHKSKYKRRERFVPYMLAVKQLPCAALIVPGHTCEGAIESDHAGPRGTKQKAHDSTVIPLCNLAHQQRADFSGPFRSWNQARMRHFLATRIAQTQRYMTARGHEIPPGISTDDLRVIASWLAPAQPINRFPAVDIREEGNVDVRHPEGATKP